jgi:hypothetical protein
LLCKIEVYYFKVTTILGRACDDDNDDNEDGNFIEDDKEDDEILDDLTCGNLARKFSDSR